MSQTATTAPGSAPRVGIADTPLRARGSRKLARPVLMIGGVVVVILASLYFWLQGGRIVSIDDSYIRAAKLSVATDVSGIVSKVAVKEGERVRTGQLLFQLDPKPFQIALDGARAQVAEVALEVDAAKQDYQRMLRDVSVRQAQVQSDQATYDRFANLVKGGGVTRSEFDDARFKLAADQASVDALKLQAQVQLAKSAAFPTSSWWTRRNTRRRWRGWTRRSGNCRTPRCMRRSTGSRPRWTSCSPGSIWRRPPRRSGWCRPIMSGPRPIRRRRT
jgi:hypothetical protein